MKTIHVNSQNIRSNIRSDEHKPVIIVWEGNTKHYCFEVEIKGPSRVVYSPDKPNRSGARLWIETEADVEMR